MKNLAKMLVINGQDLPENLKLRSTVFATSILPKERGGGRFLDLSDIGKHNVVISTTHRPGLPEHRRYAQAGRPDDPDRQRRLHHRWPL